MKIIPLILFFVIMNSLFAFGQGSDELSGSFYFCNTNQGDEMAVVDSGVETYFPNGKYYTYFTTVLMSKIYGFEIKYYLEGYGNFQVVDRTIRTKLNPETLKIEIFEGDPNNKDQQDYINMMRNSLPNMRQDYLNVLKQKIITLDDTKMITKEGDTQYAYKRVN